MGLSINDSNLTCTILMPKIPVTETPFLLHELEAAHYSSPAPAEPPFKGKGPRYFLESDSDSGRLDVAEEFDR